MARPRSEHYDDKRAMLRDEAARLFAASGYDHTSLSDIARSLGISKALVYHYYANKEELLYDIIGAHLLLLERAITARLTPAMAPADRLAAMIAALLDAYRHADAEHTVQINEMKRLPEARQGELKKLERKLVAAFSGALMAIFPRLGGDKSHLLKPLTMSLFGMMNWHYMWFREGGTMSRDDYAAFIARLMLDGATAIVGDP